MSQMIAPGPQWEPLNSLLFLYFESKVDIFLLQLILCERTTRMFLADTGKKILSSIIVKAQKVRLKPQLLNNKLH